MRFDRSTAALTAALFLTACGGRDPVADQANEGSPAPAVAAANDLRAQPVGGGGPIPAAMHGRWGLTPADCARSGTTAEGLLVVGGEELLFYESRARPAADVEHDEDSVRGDFLFTGEGQTERRFQSLQLQDGKLVRAGNGAAASFTYVRCDGPAG